MVYRKTVFAWSFPLKLDCKRSQALVHTYSRLFGYYCIVFILFTVVIIAFILPCFGGYYRNMSGIIGLFKCLTKELILSNK